MKLAALHNAPSTAGVLRASSNQTRVVQVASKQLRDVSLRPNLLRSTLLSHHVQLPEPRFVRNWCRPEVSSRAYSGKQQGPNNPEVSQVATQAAVTINGPAENNQGQGLFGSFSEQTSRLTGLAGKFMPMVGLFFLLAFVNTILDSLKDTLVITATGGGAQVIPYLTVYAVLPSSLAFLVAYSFASQVLSRPALFNAIILAFMSFFTLFAYVLYPNHAALHPHGLADGLAKILPQGLEGLVGMVRNWTFTAFFCMSELWGDVCLGLLFWGLANDTTQMSDAPTLYPLFGLGANIAQALAGWVLKSATGFSHAKGGDFSAEIQGLMLIVMGFTVAAIGLHAYINHRHEQARKERHAKRKAEAQAAAAARLQQQQQQQQGNRMNIATSPPSPVMSASMSASVDQITGNAANFGYSQSVTSSSTTSSQSVSTASSLDTTATAPKKEKKKKEKPSVKEIYKVLAASVPIRCLAVMSLAQGLCTNLMEFAWKSHIGLLFPSPAQFTSFLGDVSVWQGAVTGLLMVLSPAMFNKMGWVGVAGATPRILLWGGALFFSACLFYQFMFASHAAAALTTSAGVLAGTGCAHAATAATTSGVGGMVLQGLVFGGALLYVFSKSAKFSLFKPAEEMVYISLDEEGRTKGKAAIDVVGSQAGKSGGSVLQQALLLISGGAIGGILPVMAIFYFAMAQGWLKSVSTLGAHANYDHDALSSMGTIDEDDNFIRAKMQAAAATASATRTTPTASTSSPTNAASPTESSESSSNNGASPAAYNNGHISHTSHSGLQEDPQHVTEQTSFGSYTTNGNGSGDGRQHVDQDVQRTVNTYASMDDTTSTNIPSSLPSNWSNGYSSLPQYETARSGTAYVGYGGNGRTGALTSSNGSMYPSPARHSQGLGLHIKAPSSLLMSTGLDGAVSEGYLFGGDRGASLSPRALPEDNISSPLM